MFKKIIALLLLLVITLSFVACGGEKELTGLGRFEGLDPEIELEIIKTYCGDTYSGQESIDSQLIKHYLGTYNDCTVVAVPFGWTFGTGPFTREIVDDFIFIQYNIRIMAWKDGVLYPTVGMAFDDGALAKEDLKEIYERYKDLHLLCEAIQRATFPGERYYEFIEKGINECPNLYDREFIYKLLDLYKGEELNEEE